MEEKQSQKEQQDWLRSLLPSPIRIIEPEYFFKALMMGYDEWAILTDEPHSQKARVYFCKPKRENYLNKKCDDFDGVVEVYDTLTFTDRAQARKELSYNRFHPRDIEKEYKRYLAGEGLMFAPPIPPATYKLKADEDGFFYSKGTNWKKQPTDPQ